ncbi:MAG: hypothetical protein ACRDQ7_19905 [Haloechinothrix sp.]
MATWFEGIDPVAAVRGASVGFSILVVGGLLAPVAAVAVPLLGAVWLTLIAVLAFGVAGMRIGGARLPALHGAVAAVFAYLLVLPLVLLNEAGRDVVQVSLTFCAALAVGALAGILRARFGR